MSLVVTGRADRAQVIVVVAAVVFPFDDVISDGCPDLAAHELQLAKVAIALQHSGPHSAPRLRAIEGSPYVMQARRLPAVPLDRPVDRRSRGNGSALRKTL